MGLRKILNLEKLMDVKLNETKKSSCLSSHESYDASKKNIKKHSKALLTCFYHVKQANLNTMERMKGWGRC
jgi:hypothetical protein